MFVSVPEDRRYLRPGPGGGHRHVRAVRRPPLRHADQQQEHRHQVLHQRLPRLPCSHRRR